MKRKFFICTILYVILTAQLSLLLQSCAEGEFVTLRTPIVLTVGGGDNEDIVLTTRAAFDIQGPNFEKGQHISAYIIDSNGEYIGNPTTYTTREAVNHINELDPDVQPYFPVEDGVTVNIYALYPSKVRLTDNQFSVLDDQTKDEWYKESDLMHASLANLTNTSEKLRLHFTHKMTKVIISVTGSNGLTIKNFRLLNLYRTAEINPRTGELGTLSDRGAISVNDVSSAVVFPPQDVIASDFLEVTTTDGKVSKFSLMNKKFEAGKVYTLNVAVDEGNEGRTVSINDWPEEVGTITMASYDSPGLAVESIDRIEYRPEPVIEPTPSVSYGGNELERGRDYELQYFGNTAVGTATILVAGKGNYMGLAVATSFEIYQAQGSVEVEEESITCQYEVNGKVDYTLHITGDGTRVYNSSAPDVAEIDPETGIITMKGVGTTTITIEMLGDKNYTGDSDSFELIVEGKDIETDSRIKITISPTEYYYDGTEHKPVITMTEDGTKVDENNYEVKYENIIHRGTGKVTITGKNNYAGSVSKEFTIKQATTTLELESSDVAMAIGGTLNSRLATVYHNNKAVQYTTSNPNFGTVKYTCSCDGDIASVNETTGVVTNFVSQDIVTDQELTITATVETNEEGDWAPASASYKIIIPATKTYAFTGKVQTWTCPASGRYRLEVYGAQGGDVKATLDGKNVNVAGGKGAKVVGTVYIAKPCTLYVYVGGQGKALIKGVTGHTDTNIAGWNGGGGISGTSGLESYPITGGGGGTDIALQGTAGSTTFNEAKHWYSRIIVAGGGGGSWYYSRELESTGGIGEGDGGDAGLFAGDSGVGDDPGHGGKLNGAGEAADIQPTSGVGGTFGIGGSYTNHANEGSGAGGGGWYGGGSGGHGWNNGSGGGGSSYIWSNLTVQDRRYNVASSISAGQGKHTVTNNVYYSGNLKDVYPSNAAKPSDAFLMIYDATSSEKSNNEGNGKAIISCYGPE